MICSAADILGKLTLLNLVMFQIDKADAHKSCTFSNLESGVKF